MLLVMNFSICIAVLLLPSLCKSKEQSSYSKTNQEVRVDNSFQHNVDYQLDESGERFKLHSSGKLSKVIDLDNFDGIKRLLCVEEKILLVVQNNDIVSSWKPGHILLGSAKWGCNSTASIKGNTGGIYSQITQMYFPTKRRVSIHTKQAGPFDMIEEANIHFHYTPGDREGETVQAKMRRRRALSNILTTILGNINWNANFSTIIPFNQDEESDIPKRYFVLHKSLGDRQLTYSEYPTHEELQNVTDDFTIKCHRCHGNSRVSYTFELLIKKVNNEPKLLRYISQLNSASYLMGDIETTFTKEMALTYHQDLWSTKPIELIRIPVAVVRTLPPVELTLSYTTNTAAFLKGYVGGQSKFRTSYKSGGNYVISQQFLNGSNLAGDISAYEWNVTNREHINSTTKFGVNLTFDVQQKVLFNASISWHQRDIAIDLAPPMEMILNPSVHMLSKVKGHSQCVDIKVNVTGNFHVAKAELKVTAFGLSIWDVVLHPEISKSLTMTAQTVHRSCTAHCQGQRQLGPPQTAESVCGRISGRITRNDPRFHQELRGLYGGIMLFSSQDDNSTWCGEIGKNCSRCADNGSNISLICSNRLVSAKMATPLTKLGKLVQAEWEGELMQVLEAWDEPSSEHPNGQHNASSLHYEGRAAVVALGSAGNHNVERLGELAVCSGFDYVRILEEDGHVEVAVKKNGEPIRGEESYDLTKQMFDEAMNNPDIDEGRIGCLKSAPLLNVGDTYPDGLGSDTEMCGPLQRELYRVNQKDMNRLYHYTFDDVEFTTEEVGSWCGVKTRLCGSCDPVNSTESWDWCSTRMMIPRLAIALRTMAQTARAAGININVLGSYHEENAQTNSKREISDLYREGRGIMLTTKNGKDVQILARHAICAGIDLIRYTNESYMEGFVLPQSDYQAKLVHFIDGPNHLEVSPPNIEEYEYKYPIHLNDEDVKPLLVDAHYDQHEVSV